MGEPLAAHRTRGDAAVQDETLRLTEIFHSLQGETSRVGLPTVFVRLTGCPLRCRYCDTAYAFHGGEVWRLGDVIAAVAGYSHPPCHRDRRRAARPEELSAAA